MTLDFVKICSRSPKKNIIEIYPDFVVGRTKDLMVRAKSFYALWDEGTGLWSVDEYDVPRLVDPLLWEAAEQYKGEDVTVNVDTLSSFGSSRWLQFRSYLNHLSDNSVQLDEKLTFQNTEVKKEDYVSKRLPYSMEPGPIPAYDELMSVLYEPEERAKLEWAIGAIICGEAKKIHKFVVLYGAAGAGKSTFLSIVQMLFEGYYTTFEAKALTGQNNAFATEVFRSNPLVAIQHDGDLSRIEDNSKLNSITAHEEMTINEKYKPSYTSKINAFLFMGTNRPVKITDAKSGIIRRLIDVQPSGNRLQPERYFDIMGQIPFELGHIAAHCLDTFKRMGRDYYSGYRPIEMMLNTDVFYNFIESIYYTLERQDGITLTQAYDLYKEYCEDSNVEYKLAKYRFREELKNYFFEFVDRDIIDGVRVRSYYKGFDSSLFTSPTGVDEDVDILDPQDRVSVLDDLLQDMPAQYANEEGTPEHKWENVFTKLKDLDTSKLHYVKMEPNHIVLDFDLKDSSGEKSLALNLEAASKFPPTYVELSQGGNGVHLHYFYDGDPTRLSRVLDKDIEVKVFTGNSSLRRRLSRCANTPIRTISSGLPLKKEKPMISTEAVADENHLRTMIAKNLRKEIHSSTKPSVDFIKKLLDDAYSQGVVYDVSDMRQAVVNFAMGSTNQRAAAMKVVSSMHFTSELEREEPVQDTLAVKEEDLVFLDCEVYPNLFVISWANYTGGAHSLVNPTPAMVDEIISKPFVGFNVRKYDNHILYGAHLGYTNEQLYRLSQSIINEKKGFFREAYNLSYADMYEYFSKKQTLKKFQVELGLRHQELGLPWDEPVSDEDIPRVVEYCENDVLTERQVFMARKQDFVARKILAELSGLSVNSTTQQHTARILFGKDRNPQSKFIYTDLSEQFPGYSYSFGKSEYKGVVTGEGGLVYSEPGMYNDVAVLDVASMHPTSIRVLNLFGPYTKNYTDILDARIAIKHGDYDRAKEMLNGVLAPYLDRKDDAEALAYALKIVINIVYGLTSASFDNPFRDRRNKDNIVAKRGALFMVDLKEAVEKKGFRIIHIKTDSVKIPGATPEIIQFVVDFGKKYGYDFEHETTYSRMCLVNDAVYIAKVDDGFKPNEATRGWTATGAQFAHPIVFKQLFSQQPIEFSDYEELKSVVTSMWLDMNEDLPEGEHNLQFIGRVGGFMPVKPGEGGGLLLRADKDGSYSAVTGTKGHRWLESQTVEKTKNIQSLDRTYYDKLIDAAVDKISQYGDFEAFTA